MLDVFFFHVTHIRSLSEHVSQIILHHENPSLLSYEAGQYMDIMHHDQSVSPLSIACAPRPDQALEFHLLHPMQKLKAQDLLRMAQQDKIWQMRGPFGSCTASRLRRDKPIIFLAHGTGFAPIKAVMEAFAESSSRFSSLYLYWNIVHQTDFYLLDLLAQWEKKFNFSYQPIVSKDKNSMLDIVLHNHPEFSNIQMYVSAPRSLVSSAFALFSEHGLKREWFFSDVFEG